MVFQFNLETTLSAHLTAFLFCHICFPYQNYSFHLPLTLPLLFWGILPYPSFQTYSDDPIHLRQP